MTCTAVVGVDACLRLDGAAIQRSQRIRQHTEVVLVPVPPLLEIAIVGVDRILKQPLLLKADVAERLCAREPRLGQRREHAERGLPVRHVLRPSGLLPPEVGASELRLAVVISVSQVGRDAAELFSEPTIVLRHRLLHGGATVGTGRVELAQGLRDD